MSVWCFASMPARSNDQRPRVVVEGQQALVGEAVEKLDREERVAGGLFVHQRRERCGLVGVDAEGVGDERAEIRGGQRAQADLLGPAAGADRFELPHERVRGADFVVAVGADQQQVADVRVGRPVLEEVERGRVEPLQVVEEQGERMPGPGEDAEEAAEDQLEAALRLLRRQLGDRRLLADDELQLRDQVDHELAVRTERGAERLAPRAELGSSPIASSGRTRPWKACARVE